MNVQNVLEYFKIDFVESHPSVSSSCFGLCCPFCSNGDSNYHLGIFKDSGYGTCWKCNFKGSLFKILNKLTGCSYDEYCRVAGVVHRTGGTKENLDKIFFPINEKIIKNENISFEKKYFKSITEITKRDFELIDSFLKNKGFDIDLAVANNWKFAITGEYSRRLIIPIPNSDGFIACDTTKQSKSKYIFPKGFKAHNHIYLTGEKKGKTWIIVEGIFDACAISRICYGAIAIFGKKATENQMNKIISYTKPNEEIIVCLDADARKEQKNLAFQLKPFFKKTKETILPKNHDPASLPITELFYCVGMSKSV